jgi:hypothetical protein
MFVCLTMLKDMSKVPFASAVGCLMYTIVCTKSHLAQAISVVSKYMANPGRQHWDTIKWIFRYLRGSTDYGITFVRQKRFISCGVDGDYTRDLDDKRSTTGYVFTLVGGPIYWRTIIQPTIAMSTSETKYMVAAEAAKEALWLIGLVKELGIQKGGVQLHCDGHSAIYLSKNKVYHARTEHIDVRFHKIRELVAIGELY